MVHGRAIQPPPNRTDRTCLAFPNGLGILLSLPPSKSNVEVESARSLPSPVVVALRAYSPKRNPHSSATRARRPLEAPRVIRTLQCLFLTRGYANCVSGLSRARSRVTASLHVVKTRIQ
ncbi:hypothetical protein FA13DRAFT_1292768 [Coprinellus micaceus]|uniref:Uncharacterized protein n=1 Tax=Coprinellus micaceus TaxID=71717 RepID=A0A4Y7SS27_COPMI|nr:hypothetical protein FA13DRAFT_1292768 [Coprinellus micaceus]